MSSEALDKDITWHHEIEQYFANTGEKALCLSHLHKKAEQRYSSVTMWIDLPVIILSVINGAVSMGSTSLFGNQEIASVGVGAVALLTGILNALGSYFSWSRRCEAHKISAINYSKLYRFLSIELSLPRVERMSPADLLKYVKTEYDRLQEISPLIPPSVLLDFTKRTGELKDISLPEEASAFHPISVFKEDPNLRAVISNLQMKDDSSELSSPNYIV